MLVFIVIFNDNIILVILDMVSVVWNEVRIFNVKKKLIINV